ncbi:MAG: HTH-type transcriptional regulator LutR [Syntrophomonadaceae bacterium]|nr:HTH-type transcriptional regulator LutR [Bacillota bacterium]
MRNAAGGLPGVKNYYIRNVGRPTEKRAFPLVETSKMQDGFSTSCMVSMQGKLRLNEGKPLFKPIKQKRVYEGILEQVQQLVTEGALKSGDRLISEREMAERLQVSRASVREAFSALDMLGILESRPGEGTYIRTVPRESALKPLALIVMLYNERKLDIMEVRMILEAESAALAAQRATAADLVRIKACLNRLEQDFLNDRLGETSDADFHMAIADATENMVLAWFMDTVSDLLKATMRYSRQRLFENPQNKEMLLQQHREIFEAISCRNPQGARQAMTEHLKFVCDIIAVYEKEYEESENGCLLTAE